MVDALAAVISSVVAGLAGGFLSSWMAWNSSGEKFDVRKHGNALITGALSGMALGIAAIATGGSSDLAPEQFAVQLFTTFLASAGIDRLRSSGSHMITPTAIRKLARGDIEGAKEAATKPSPPPPPEKEEPKPPS